MILSKISKNGPVVDTAISRAGAFYIFSSVFFYAWLPFIHNPPTGSWVVYSSLCLSFIVFSYFYDYYVLLSARKRDAEEKLKHYTNCIVVRLEAEEANGVESALVNLAHIHIDGLGIYDLLKEKRIQSYLATLKYLDLISEHDSDFCRNELKDLIKKAEVEFTEYDLIADIEYENNSSHPTSTTRTEK